MANNNVITPYHALQPSFATGEISREVANRVDLDKYQAALTKAKNVLIRPYGPVYKRPGSEYIVDCKRHNSKCILQGFTGKDNNDYLLEIGAYIDGEEEKGYIRALLHGELILVPKTDNSGEILLDENNQPIMTDVIAETPFIADDLPNLRFTQSADTMFIASGTHTVQILKHEGDTWKFGEYTIEKPYFDDSLGDGSEDCKITPSDTEGSPTLTSTENIFTEDMKGGYIKLSQDVASKTVSGKITSSTSKVDNIDGTHTSASVYVTGRYKLSIDGKWNGNIILQYSANGVSWTDGSSYIANTWYTTEPDPITGKTQKVDAPIFGTPAISSGCYYRIKAVLNNTSTKINATLTSQTYASKAWKNVGSVTLAKSVSDDGWLSDELYVGENWKIITHGTWAGTVKVQSSLDQDVWRDYRTYTGNSDYNVTESGSLAEPQYIRLVVKITSGTCTVDLTALSYVHEGYAQIDKVENAKEAVVSVKDRFGNTDATKQWSFSAWNKAFGYPRTVAFFQDRFCLGGSNKQPYMLWMSRTGDYNNFSVTKADGKITDDSAVALSFVSRKQFDIRHLVPNTDLLILTQGNEWILSGNEIITPSSATPKMQTTRGCGNIEPVMIGSKTVFVQGRGSVVRDMGYSYETDSYGGVDLTLLDKPIVSGHKLIDGTYMQEPNSSIYFVRDDGVIAILSYVIDQKIYAWSRFETKGEFESICAVAEGDIDTIYVVVNRDGKRYIERFQADVDSPDPNDYIMLDCATIVDNEEATQTLYVPQLSGEHVTVLGDGRQFENVEVSSDGVLILPTLVKKAVIGLPYEMEIELPNIEMKVGDGTMQGRLKTVPEIIMRLYNTLGGFAGPSSELNDEIVYDEFQAVENIMLYSGDKKMQIPIGGFNTDGRVTIKSSDAYPFNLLAMVREVSFGG